MKSWLLPALLCCNALAAAQGARFDSIVAYPVKQKVVGLKVEDITGDRIPDITVMYNANTPEFGILQGAVNGRFGPEQSHPKPLNYQRCDIADFNKDGFPDLVISSYWDNGIRVFYGNAAGDFGTGIYFATGVHGREVICTDINKDGYEDIITTTSGSAHLIVLHVFINKGDGTFHPRQSYPSQLDSCQEIFVTDKNGDGLPDIVVTSAFPWVMYCYQQPNGSFVDKYLETQTTARAAVADLNLDGREDLLLLYSSFDNMPGSDSLLLLMNTVDTAFARPVRIPQVGPHAISANLLKVADLNRDGFPDLVLNQLDRDGAPADTLFYLAGLPEGGFQPPVKLPMPANVLLMRVADINNDGLIDLVAACDDNTIYTLFNTGDAGNKAGRLHLYPNPSSKDLYVGELGEGQHQITLYNTAGMLLHTFTTTNLLFRCSIAHLPAGIYHLVVRDGQGRRTASFRKL